MSIAKMHYDVKFKLNKVASSQYQNLRVPEIDIALNEAYYLFVKKIGEPRFPTKLGFETSQRNIDSLRNLVIDNKDLVFESKKDDYSNFLLPDDYMFYIGGRIYIDKNLCKNKRAKLHIVRHNDFHEEDVNSKSSFEWREVNAIFHGNFIKAFHEEFDISRLTIDYIKKLSWIHNAKAFKGQTYKHIGTNEMLTGQVDCPLPLHTHDEIVDIAVKIISGIIEKPNSGEYDSKINFDWT